MNATSIVYLQHWYEMETKTFSPRVLEHTMPIDHHSTQNLPCILKCKLGHYLTGCPCLLALVFNSTALYVDVFVCDADVFLPSVMINRIICVFITLGMTHYEGSVLENNTWRQLIFSFLSKSLLLIGRNKLFWDSFSKYNNRRRITWHYVLRMSLWIR